MPALAINIAGSTPSNLCGSFRHVLERAVQQIAAIRQVQVFRYALAIRDIEQPQVVTHDHIKRRRQTGSLVDLGQNATGQGFSGVGAHHIVQRIATGSRIEQQ